jgi:CheY-like chemotaxis protein
MRDTAGGPKISNVARVLVVEDDAQASEALTALLTGRGLSVLAADEGRKALELMATWRPAVVLLDLHMPGMGGREFRERQQADPRIAAIPVVVMTADRAGGVPAHRTLRKPFTADELLSAIAPFVPSARAGARSPSGHAVE